MAGDDEDQSLTKQLLSMVLENNAIRETVFPYMVSWMVFNAVILLLLVWITFKLTFGTTR
jgi:hypothetical protein